MADEPKKPKKIKDLKARLGRTISPNTPGAVMPPGVTTPASGADASGEVSPPVVASPAASKGAVLPPSNSILPGARKKAVPVNSPFAPKQPKAPEAIDPFSASPSQAPPAGPQQVRLVFDDSQLDNKEIGRKNTMKYVAVAVAALALGGAFGGVIGGSMSKRSAQNATIEDAQAIESVLQTATTRIEQAQGLIDEAARKAVADSEVDYESIEALRAIEMPFDANAFVGRNYVFFEPATVNALFMMYMKTQQAWDLIDSIGNLTAGDERREQLNAAASSNAESRSLIGCVPGVTDNRLVCSLGFVDIVEENGQTQVKVRESRAARRSVDKQVFSGQDLSENPQDYVILVNSAQSRGVLGEQSTLFNDYTRRIANLKVLLEEIMELRSTAQQGVGEIAAMESL